MRSSAFYAVLGTGILLVIGIVWYAGFTHKKATARVPEIAPKILLQNATSTPSLKGLSIYTNGQYGFSLLYPGSFPVHDSSSEMNGAQTETFEIGTTDENVTIIAQIEGACPNTSIASSTYIEHEGTCFILAQHDTSPSENPALVAIIRSFAFARE